MPTSTSTRSVPPAAGQPPSGVVLPLAHEWSEVFHGQAGVSLAAALRQWLPSRRWFRGKARTMESISLREQIAVPMGRQKAFLLLFEVNYGDNCPELYVQPLACAFGPRAAAIGRDWPQLILARVALNHPRRNGVLYDALVSKEFCRALLTLTAHRRLVAGRRGELEAEPTGLLRRIRREQRFDLEPSVSKAEQSNSSIIFGNRVILKFFRRLDPGINPELEIERFLAARGFAYSPPLAGSLEYRDYRGRTSTLAVLTSFIPGCHDAWEDTLRALRSFYRRVQRLDAPSEPASSVMQPPDSIFGQTSLPEKPGGLVGSYLKDAATLGRRTAALHLTLASDATDPSFRPEPWTPQAQRSFFASLQQLTQQNFSLLRQRLPGLGPNARMLAEKVVPLESQIMHRLHRITERAMETTRIRTHGDYHLGQVLHHGKDFLIIDFEGEPALSLQERRIKQSALRDVAGMIYSFCYAAHAAAQEQRGPQSLQLSLEKQSAWARYWSVWVGTTFLRTYLAAARTAPFIPADELALKILLDVELLRKAIYELGYELNNRPNWVNIAFQVLLDLLNPENPI